MYPLLLKGFLLGLSLSFMIGPLFFSIMESALDRGHRFGLAVAVGIWCSDALFIVAVLSSVQSIIKWVNLPGFDFWAASIGAAVLIGFGVASWINGYKMHRVRTKEQQILADPKGYFGTWLKGFLINSVNPGTLVFWLGTATGIVAPNNWSVSESSLFFGSMMAVLIATDLLKVYGAKHLRKWLTPHHISWVQRGVGLVLIGLGVVMLAQRF